MESGEKHELKGVGDVKVHVQTDDNHPDIQLGRVTQIGNIRVLGLEPADADFYSSFPVDRRAKLLRKIDLRVPPVLAILYLTSNLDRSNIGNANIEGLSHDLHLTGVQYNVCLSIFFVTFVVFALPSNMILKKFDKPAIHMGVLVTGWGIVVTLTGVIQNYAGLLALRLLLGLFEAGFYAAALYICTSWYMPQELATRVSYFYLMSAIASAVSGLLAAAIVNMDGVGGYEAWRWIFILEGLAAVLLGVLTFWLLAGSPAKAKWLSAEEKKYLQIQAFIKDGGEFGKKTTRTRDWLPLRQALTDWKLYVMSFLFFVDTGAGYGVKFTMPSIIKGMGFKGIYAQLLTAPPYLVGAISAVAFSKLSDRFYCRMPFVVIPWLIWIVGYAIIEGFGTHTAEHVGPAYFAVFLVCIGLFPVNPALAAWTANNMAPHDKRAVGLAIYLSLGNIGGIVGSFIFINGEAPAYPTGYGTSQGLLAVGVIVALGLDVIFVRINRKRDRLLEQDAQLTLTGDDPTNLDDRSALFRYTL